MPLLLGKLSEAVGVGDKGRLMAVGCLLRPLSGLLSSGVPCCMSTQSVIQCVVCTDVIDRVEQDRTRQDRAEDDTVHVQDMHHMRLLQRMLYM